MSEYINNYGKMERLLADIDAPIQRMDDTLINIQDDLRGK